MITLDFETMPIEGNPLVNPPKPIGLAVQLGTSTPEYYTEWEQMKSAWLSSLDSEYDLLFHNAPFDLSVGLKWLGGDQPHWSKIHDTLYILFLADPYSTSLSLKPSADRYLDLPAQEQDELHDWIMVNVPEATKKTAGAYIYRAPIQLVEKYAKGDVLRTRLLYDKLIDSISQEAYDRERELAPLLTASSVAGIRLDRERLEADLEAGLTSISTAEERLFSRLNSEPFNLRSGVQLADALDKAGLVDEWIMTAPSKTYPDGQRSTSRDNLTKVCKDPEITELLSYISVMNTCTGTFMAPWLEFSDADGRLHTEWNQVANDEDGHGGARTGRMSSRKPNFQNPPNPFGISIPEGMAHVPNMRSYLLPEEGHRWIKRDFSSQEIRILAHFEDGPLMIAYNRDPFLDPHQMAKELIHDIVNIDFPRKDVKMTGFGIIYGMGVPGLAQSIGRPRSEAHTLREAYFKAMPAAAKLAASTRNRGRSGGVIRTWGGREYPVEPAKVIKGKMRTFEYKLLNYLIQGSAGDQTKQVLIDWHKSKSDEVLFTSAIHDEINASVPEDDWHYHMEVLKLNMDQDLFDVPMRSEGFHGPNWGELTEMTREEDYDL